MLSSQKQSSPLLAQGKFMSVISTISVTELLVKPFSEGNDNSHYSL
jgi:hypothetical protein